MKLSFTLNFIFVFAFQFALQMNLWAYTCPAPVNYYCSSDNVIILHDLGDLPQGGIFTLSNQTTVTQINPSNYPNGAEIAIHYLYRYVTGATLTCDFLIIIRAAPQISCPKLLSFCWSLNDIFLGDHPGFTPLGGAFSGNFISSDGNFDCENAGPGNHLVTYTVTDNKTGCTNSCQSTINVVNGEISNCPTRGVFLCYDDAIDLAKVANVQPAGGIYLGDNVSNNTLFAPEPGTYEITYWYERNQGCDGICKFTITLYPLPDFECPDDMLICNSDGGLISLPYPQKYGWNYNGDGVIVQNGIPKFDPLKAGKGVHEITITIFSDNQCEKVCVFYITVGGLSIDCPKMLEVCANSSTDLSKLWNFNPNGEFSGDMVSSDGIFYAPVVYERVCSSVKYILKDEYNCTDTCDFVVCIIPLPPVVCPDTVYACFDEPRFPLISNAPGTFYYNGKEIPGVIVPSEFGVGNYVITYTHEYSDDPYCSITCEFVLVIYPKPELICPSDTTLCLIDGVVILPDPGFPSWEYSGKGVYLLNGEYAFDPHKAGLGKHPINLLVTDKNGCKALCEFVITVVDFQIECPKELWVCAGKETNLLSQWNFNPEGTFSGDYVSNNGVFDAPMVYENKCVDITYSLINELGCESTCTFKVCIYAAPWIDCPEVVYLCIDDRPYLPDIDSNYQLYWNGNEIPNGFNPAVAGVGSHEVKIVCHGNNQLKCEYSCSFIIKVIPKPQLECPNYITLCSPDQVITLPILPWYKYHYTGTGVFSQGGLYYFTTPKPGEYVLTAVISDEYGCSDTCNFLVTVGNFDLECPKKLEVCPDVKTDLTQLWNFDPRGEFIGKWVTSDGIFIAPYIPDNNNCYKIKYRIVIDDNCKDSCVFIVCVKPVPSVKCPDTMVVCLDTPLFNPAVGTNALVYFNGKPIPNGFNPSTAGPGTHILTFEYPIGQSECYSYCEMVVIVNPLPEVKCPRDFYICNPKTVIKLPEYNYASYEYSGTGIYYQNGIAYFASPTNSSGSYVITLTVKDEHGCTNSCKFTITVGDIVARCPEILTVCPNSTTDLTTLWNFHPGGIFSGAFVDFNGNFDAPTVYGNEECFPISFIIKTPDGCVDSCTFKVCVLPLPEIKCPDTIHVCLNDTVFNPMPNAPGTVFFNNQPIPNGFNPQQAGVGTHDLYYTYIHSKKPLCEYECKFVIVVHALPEIECPNDIIICSTDQKINLPLQPYPNYTYNGLGVVFDSGVYYFDATLAGTGNHLIVLAVYNEYGCKSICRFTIFVEGKEIECPDTLWVCMGNDWNLNRLWNFPQGGIFAGDGVTQDGHFYPDEVAEEQCIDLSFYYYTNKCKDSCKFTVCIEPIPDIDCPDTIHTCESGIPFIPIPNASGTFYFKGQPLPNGFFNPMAYSTGQYTVTYIQEYGHNRDCKFVCDIVIVIHPRKEFECPDDLLVCDSDIENILLPDLPYNYFEYAGNFVEGEIGEQVFVVASAGVGVHYVAVTVQDEWGCKASCRFKVIVGENKIECPDTLYLCSGEKYPLNRLTNLPGGGQFIGENVTNNWFVAPIAENEDCYPILYVLKDKFGCVDSCEFVICVQGAKEMICPDTIRVCEGDQAFIPNVHPAGGKFFLNGNLLPDGVFDPLFYGTGVYTVYYYHHTDEPYFCPVNCSFVILVEPKPIIQCPRVIYLCQDDAPLIFDGTIWPTGGSYVLNGDTITSFSPSEPGKYVVAYHYTDQGTVCSAWCEFIIHVSPKPKAICPKDMIVCAGDETLQLSGGEPQGGEYHYNGISVSNFSTGTPGEYIIWYVYRDKYTGCLDSCSFKITVIVKPEIECPDKITVCSTDKVNLFEYIQKPQSESYTYGFTGPGLSGTHNEVFSPFNMQQGEYQITYTISIGDCASSCTFWIVVVRPPIELICPDDMVLCTSANAINISALLSPTGATPSHLSITGEYLIQNAPNTTIWFDPGKVNPSDYGKPIIITATSCTWFNNRADSCCSNCNFTITVVKEVDVECTGNIFACEAVGAIDLLDYVAPKGGEFYYNGYLIPANFSLANHPTYTDIPILYYYPQKGVECADSCLLTLKILPFPTLTLRDTIWPGNDPLIISNNSASNASDYFWFSDGDGSFTDPNVLHPTYNAGMSDFHTGKITIHLRALNGECESKASMTAKPAQLLYFPPQWSGVSLYRDPEEDNLEKLVEPIKDNLNIIYNLKGDKYPPSKSVQITWDTQSGYIANCKNGSSILVPGTYSDGQTLQVSAGWNLIPILSSCPVDPAIFNSNNNLIMIKEVAGLNVYWPAANVFDLTQLEPGKAYIAGFIGSEAIVFPPCGTISSSGFKSLANDPFIPEEWGELHMTPISFVIALPLDQFAGEEIVDGDVIGAFTPEGILAGVCEIGLNNVLVLFGDDPLTPEKDGFALGDPITFRLYKRNSNENYGVEATEVSEGSISGFEENGVAQIEEVELTGSSSPIKATFVVYPNPVKSNVFIINPVDMATATIFNTTGQLLLEKQLATGTNQLSVETLRDGVYVIQLKNKEQIAIFRLIKY
jgi:hypothetical protein